MCDDVTIALFCQVGSLLIIDSSRDQDDCSISLPKRMVSSAVRRFGCELSDESDDDEEEEEDVESDDEDVDEEDVEDGYDQQDSDSETEEEEEAEVVHVAVEQVCPSLVFV